MRRFIFSLLIGILMLSSAGCAAATTSSTVTDTTSADVTNALREVNQMATSPAFKQTIAMTTEVLSKGADGLVLYQKSISTQEKVYILLGQTAKGEIVNIMIYRGTMALKSVYPSVSAGATLKDIQTVLAENSFSAVPRHQWPAWITAALNGATTFSVFARTIIMGEFTPFFIIITPDLFNCFYPSDCTT